MTMKKAEVALVTIPLNHAFSSIESKQDLAVVPPDSTMYYAAELASFMKIDRSSLVHDFLCLNSLCYTK